MCFSVVLTFGGSAQVGKDDLEGIGLHTEYITDHSLVVQRFICVDDPGAVIDSEHTCKHKLIREQFIVSSTPMMSAQATRNSRQCFFFSPQMPCSPTQPGTTVYELAFAYASDSQLKGQKSVLMKIWLNMANDKIIKLKC